jgi:hypothetical protein
VTGKALRIIEGWLSDECLMRIVTGDAGNAAIFRIVVVAGTLSEAVGLKAKISGAPKVWHCHHFFSAAMTSTA